VQAWDRHQVPPRPAMHEPRRMRLGLY